MEKAPKVSVEWIVTAECPKCGAEHEDLDGVGVLYCPDCGYCTHASVNGHTCSLCGESA